MPGLLARHLYLLLFEEGKEEDRDGINRKMGLGRKIVGVAIIFLISFSFAGRCYALDFFGWIDSFLSVLKSNFGNIEDIGRWLTGAQVLDNNGNIKESFTVDPNRNTVIHNRYMGGAVVGGDRFEAGGGWRFGVIDYTREGVYLRARYEAMDATHTQIIIYDGGMQIAFNISYSEEQGAKINDSVIKDFVEKGLGGKIKFNKNGLEGDNTGEEEGISLNLAGLGEVKVTIAFITFSNGWVNSHMHDLKNAVFAALDKFGIKMGTLEGETEASTWDKIIETLKAVKTPQPAEEIGLQLNISFDNEDDDEDWDEIDAQRLAGNNVEEHIEEALRDGDAGWFVSSIIVRGAELMLETPFKGNGRDDINIPPRDPAVTGTVTNIAGKWYVDVIVWTNPEKTVWEEVDIILDLSLLSEEERKEIEAVLEEYAQSGEQITLYGLTATGDITPNCVLQVLGLGKGPFEEHPFDL